MSCIVRQDPKEKRQFLVPTVWPDQVISHPLKQGNEKAAASKTRIDTSSETRYYPGRQFPNVSSYMGNPLKITGIMWVDDVVDKLEQKHDIQPREAHQIFGNHPLFRYVEKGHRPGENVYAVGGRTDAHGD